MTTRYTNSELKTWKRCQRKWWLTYYRRLGLKRSDPVGAAPLGTLVHAGLEALYGGASAEDAIDVMSVIVARDSIALAEHLEPVDFERKMIDVDKQAELARIMFEGYVEWLEEEGADFGMTVIGPERAVEVPIAGLPGRTLLGKIDLQVQRDTDGAILALDHKTVQTAKDRLELAHMDEQFLHYHLIEYLAHLDGQLPGRSDGILLNMLRKVKRTGTSKPPFYIREEIHHNEEHLRSHWKHVMRTILQIEEARTLLSQGIEHHDVVVPNVTRDCTWDCPFFAVCPMMDDSSDATWNGLLDATYDVIDPYERYVAEDAKG